MMFIMKSKKKPYMH